MRLLAALAFAVTLSGQRVAPPARVNIEGVVVNSVTGAGIAGATVTIGTHQAVTALDGTFTLTGVEAYGMIFLSARKSGFGSSPQMMRVDPSKDTVSVRLELKPNATLRGRVFGIDGKPVSGVTVDAGAARAITAEDGSFVLENVMPGSWALRASPAETKVTVAEDGSRIATVPAYFPSATERGFAAEILVLPGADQGGYDIHLQTARVYRIRGVVMDADGKLEPDATVELHARPDVLYGRFVKAPGSFFPVGARPASEQSDNRKPMVTDANGAFEFPVVRAGDWTVLAIKSRDPTHVLYGSSPVRIARSDADVRIDLEPRFEVSVSFELSDGSPAPRGAAMGARLHAEDGGFNPDELEAKGSVFAISDVRRARYHIEPLLAPNARYYVASVLVGSVDASTQAVELSAASPPIRVILKPGTAIHGTVEDGAGATVLLWPENAAPGDLGGSVTCDASGNFQFSGVAPGDYYALAVREFSSFDFVLRYLNGDGRLKAVEAKAAQVRVEEGAAASIQLRLTPDFP